MLRQEMMIELVKQEISAFAESLTLKNIPSVSEGITGQLAILAEINKASFLDTIISSDINSHSEYPEVEQKDEEGNEENEKDDEISISEVRLKEEVIDDGQIVRGYFTQMIRGGTLHAKKKIFIPESVCRTMNLTTGDFLEARREGDTLRKKPRYTYHLIAKTEKIVKVREEVEFLTVKKHLDLNRLFIEIKDDSTDMLSPILISDADIVIYKLNEGDIVNYAYKPGNILKGYVTWKHRGALEVAEKEDPVTTVKKKRTVRKRKRHLPLFQGLTILMIGGTNKSLHKSVKKEITSRKGVFSYLSGDEPKEHIISEIRKADIVVIYTQSISHDAMHLAKEYCKARNIVHTFTKNIGSTQFVRRVSLLKKKLIPSNA